MPKDLRGVRSIPLSYYSPFRVARVSHHHSPGTQADGGSVSIQCPKDIVLVEALHCTILWASTVPSLQRKLCYGAGKRTLDQPFSKCVCVCVCQELRMISERKETKDIGYRTEKTWMGEAENRNDQEETFTLGKMEGFFLRQIVTKKVWL